MAVYRKELRQYFHSVIGYVFLAIFIFINSYYFLLQNLLTRSGDITDYLQSAIGLMMFLMPMLTMRSFSEEKKQRTDILLYTSPIDRRDIVLGKFFAAETMLLIGMGVTFAFPVTLAFCGSMRLFVTLGSYLGVFLLMSDFIAIGIFLSALTENQIVAAVLSYVVIFTLWYSYGLGTAIQNQAVLAVFSRLSLMWVYNELSMGILNPAGILLNVLVLFVFLFLTVAIVRERRR